MEHRILINNLGQNPEGIYGLLLQVEIINEGELWTKAEMCNAEDIALVVADQTAINDVALRLAQRAVIARPTEKEQEDFNRSKEVDELKLETIKQQVLLEKLKLGIID